MSESHAQADLAHARGAADQLAAEVKCSGLNLDPLVIAAVGDLHVRLDAAQALQQEAADGLAARLAAAHALAQARELHVELTGQSLPISAPGERPSHLRRVLGEQYLKP